MGVRCGGELSSGGIGGGEVVQLVSNTDTLHSWRRDARNGSVATTCILTGMRVGESRDHVSRHWSSETMCLWDLQEVGLSSVLFPWLKDAA